MAKCDETFEGYSNSWSDDSGSSSCKQSLSRSVNQSMDLLIVVQVLVQNQILEVDCASQELNFGELGTFNEYFDKRRAYLDWVGSI